MTHTFAIISEIYSFDVNTHTHTHIYSHTYLGNNLAAKKMFQSKKFALIEKKHHLTFQNLPEIILFFKKKKNL